MGLRRPFSIGDLKGGMTAAMIGIPVELIYGLIATAPLGMAYQATGVSAAFNACIVAAVAAAAAGMHLGQIPGSRPALALISAALLTELTNRWPGWFGVSADPAQLLLVMFATVSLSGLIQIGFGLFRLGYLTKYLPAPALTGIANGIAVLMVIQVLKPLFGLPGDLVWRDPGAVWDAIRWPSLLIGFLAAYFYVKPPMFLRAIPPIMVSLFASLAAYYAVALLFGGGQVGSTFGDLYARIPEFVGHHIANAEWMAQRGEIFRVALPYSIAIATLASIESLLSASAVDAMRQTRHQSNRELVAQGVGNLAAGLFGGTPVGATMPRTMANTHAGAVSSLAAVVYSATMLAAILWFSRWMGAVPQVSAAGILIGVAWQMIDPWSRRTLRTMIRRPPEMPIPLWQAIVANGFVMVAVALTVILLGLVWALGLGVLLTTVFFLRENQRAVIRSVSNGLTRRSLRIRSPEQNRFLDALGGDVIIVEAQGPLFFASADKLGRELEDRAIEGDFVVLDVSRVSSIDATAARVLQRVATGLARSRKKFLLSGVDADQDGRREIAWALVDTGMSKSHWYPDLDSALDAIEEEILSIRFNPQDRWRRHDLGETALGAMLTQDELTGLRAYLEERQFEPRAPVYLANELGDCLYVLAEGAVSLYIEISPGKQVRHSAVSAGALFGAAAMLEGRLRTSAAICDVASVVYLLRRDALMQLDKEDPELAAKLYRNLSIVLAERVRHALASARSAAG